MPSESDVVIVPYRDGPYLVRGPVTVRDQNGNDVVISRDPVALCRCGKSQMRPFCDGTHQLIRFQAPSEPERPYPVAASEPARPRDRVEPASGGDPSALRRAADLVTHALDTLLDAGAAQDADLHAAVAALRASARELGHQL